MSQKTLLQFLSLLFFAKAIFGVLYILLGWQVTFSGWVMPIWLIAVAVGVDSYFAYLACKYSKGKK